MPTAPKTSEAKARKLFRDRYEKSFLAAGGDEKFPQMRAGLMELARVEAQLDEVAKAIERRELAFAKNGGTFEDVVVTETKDGEDLAPLIKAQQMWRQQHARIKKNLNLSLERREHVKASAKKAAEDDDRDDFVDDPLDGIDD